MRLLCFCSKVLAATSLRPTDLQGYSDPYCVCYLKVPDSTAGGSGPADDRFRGQRGETYFCEKTLNPKWSGQRFIFKVWYGVAQQRCGRVYGIYYRVLCVRQTYRIRAGRALIQQWWCTLGSGLLGGGDSWGLDSTDSMRSERLWLLHFCFLFAAEEAIEIHDIAPGKDIHKNKRRLCCAVR